mgnify:CR=1 FL=1
MARDIGEDATYLSGNGPLVDVLRDRRTGVGVWLRDAKVVEDVPAGGGRVGACAAAAVGLPDSTVGVGVGVGEKGSVLYGPSHTHTGAVGQPGPA